MHLRISPLSRSFALERAEFYARDLGLSLRIREAQVVPLAQVWTDQPRLSRSKLEFIAEGARGEPVLQITLLRSFFVRDEREVGPIFRVEEGNHRLKILRESGETSTIANIIEPAEHGARILFRHRLSRPWDLPIATSEAGLEVHSDATLMERRLKSARLPRRGVSNENAILPKVVE